MRSGRALKFFFLLCLAVALGVGIANLFFESDDSVSEANSSLNRDSSRPPLVATLANSPRNATPKAVEQSPDSHLVVPALSADQRVDLALKLGTVYPLEWNSLELSAEVAKLLELGPESLRKVNDSLRSFYNELAGLEQAAASLRTDESGNEVLSIEAYDASSALRTLQDNLAKAVDDQRSALIKEVVTTNRFAGKLGSFRQEIWTRAVLSNASDKSLDPVQLSYTFFHSDGRQVYEANVVSVEAYNARYGAIIKSLFPK